MRQLIILLQCSALLGHLGMPQADHGGHTMDWTWLWPIKTWTQDLYGCHVVSSSRSLVGDAYSPVGWGGVEPPLDWSCSGTSHRCLIRMGFGEFEGWGLELFVMLSGPFLSRFLWSGQDTLSLSSAVVVRGIFALQCHLDWRCIQMNARKVSQQNTVFNDMITVFHFTG